MKVSQIAKICKEMANLDLPANCYQGEFDDYTSSDVAKKLLFCCNFVLEEIYCNYATALTSVVVFARDGVVDTSQLTLCNVVKLTDAQGNDVAFRYTERGLFVELDGVYNLTYAKLPTQVGWKEDFSLPNPRITPTVFALGVLAEYFLQIGDHYQSDKYRARFCQCLQLAFRKLSTQKLPARRWW